MTFFFDWFWYFCFYSLCGFVFEVLFARLSGGRRDRKAMLLLPMCPVYGFGACAILLLPRAVGERPISLFFLGGLTAAVVEYLAAVLYEKGLGVRFWDYSELAWNLHGRVCLPFGVIWGVMALSLTGWLHPIVRTLPAGIPVPVSLCAMAAVGCDLAVSAWMMRSTGGRECLQWYRSP